MLPLVSKLDWMAQLAKGPWNDAMHQRYPENCKTIQFETLKTISQPSADLIFSRPFWRWIYSDTSLGASKANKTWQSLPPDCFFVDGNWPVLQLYICLMVVVNGITAKLQPCHRQWSMPPLLLRVSSRILDLNERAAAGKGTFFAHYPCWCLQQFLFHWTNLPNRFCTGFDFCSGDSFVWTVTNVESFVAKETLY